MYALNAPGYRGHFAILVRVDTPWLFFYDTIDKVYFMTNVSDLKRAEKLVAHSPDDRHKLPYVDYAFINLQGPCSQTGLYLV